jgi:hypothetical protein
MKDPRNPGTTPGAPPQSTAEDKPAQDRLVDQARDTAQSAVDDVTAEAASRADTAKESVADEMSGISSALRTAAREMRDGSPQERTFGQIADGLADASEAMRDKDLGEMVGDLASFARRNPMVFIGGAVLVGFVATRFAVASDPAARQSASRASGRHEPVAPGPVATTAPATGRDLS